jgi:hypothetical protein
MFGVLGGSFQTDVPTPMLAAAPDPMPVIS